jgi:GNAT superfamily N-acetyltransferase
VGEVITITPGSQAAVCAADWLKLEWPGIPIIDWLRQPAQDSREMRTLPVVLGYQSLGSGELYACGALLLDDMDDRPKLNPWLGCLYVEPNARRQGIGRHLVRDLVDSAKALGISTLYLFCDPQLRSFYESEGWSAIEERTYEGKPCIVMERRSRE